MYKIQTALDIALSSDPQQRVMASRRRVVALGVLSDALIALWRDLMRAEPLRPLPPDTEK